MNQSLFGDGDESKLFADGVSKNFHVNLKSIVENKNCSKLLKFGTRAVKIMCLQQWI